MTHIDKNALKAIGTFLLFSALVILKDSTVCSWFVTGYGYFFMAHLLLFL